mgnify:CR=1 FL=1|jgi:helicase
MKLEDLNLSEELVSRLGHIKELRPSQKKAISAGLLDGKSVVVCTPTASGKTFIAELASIRAILEKEGKVVYLVPLVALAREKYKEFKERYDGIFKVAMSIGDYDSSDSHLIDADLIISTSEKLDSLIRHHAPWVMYTKLLVVDEIHLLNHVGRGPTLEILITMMKRLIKDVQILGLSATIGNPKELAGWLGAELVQDNWRPVPLQKGVLVADKLTFVDDGLTTSEVSDD